MSEADAVTQWQKSLLRFLYINLIDRITKDEQEKRKYFISPPGELDRKGIWFEAFTDPTIIGEPNYERLEKLGDAILHVAVIELLESHFPDSDPGDLDGLVSYYTSNVVFADMVKRLLPQIPGLIRIIPGVKINDAVLADIFEALFGAIHQVGNLVDGKGQERSTALFSDLLFEWLTLTTGKPEFNAKFMQGDIKTQVEEIFTRNGVAPPPQTVYRSDDYSRIYIEVKMTHKQINFLQNSDPKIRGLRPQTFTADGTSKQLATRAVYTKVLEYLNANGVTTEWAGGIKSKSDLLGLAEIDPELPILMVNKLKADGYDRVAFKKVAKHTVEGHQTVMILKGRRAKINKHDHNEPDIYDDLAVVAGKAHTVVGLLARKYVGVAEGASSSSRPATSGTSKPVTGSSGSQKPTPSRSTPSKPTRTRPEDEGFL